MTSANPNQALGYSEVALACSGSGGGTQGFELGSTGLVPNLSFEVFGFGIWGGNVQDAPILTPPAAICQADISGGGIGSITILFAPSYFTVAPTVLIVGNGGGATAHSTINSSGLLTSIIIDSAGSGYSSATVYVGNTLQTAQGGIIPDYLTNPLWGVGGDMGFFPFEIGDTTDVATYTLANSLLFSLSLESQQTAAEITRRLLRAANSEAFWSEGVLKFVSYGDTSAVGNGVLYTPNTTPVYDLDIDNYLAGKKEEPGPAEDPITIERSTVADRNNRWTIEWSNRYASYNPEPITEDDD
jgi:hypothetical protein